MRDVSRAEAIYDPIYHQGSVWPLYTGLDGFGGIPRGPVTFRATISTVWVQQLASIKSSAMVLTPALRGLFGLDVDATNKW